MCGYDSTKTIEEVKMVPQQYRPAGQPKSWFVVSNGIVCSSVAFELIADIQVPQGLQMVICRIINNPILGYGVQRLLHQVPWTEQGLTVRLHTCHATSLIMNAPLRSTLAR